MTVQAAAAAEISAAEPFAGPVGTAGELWADYFREHQQMTVGEVAAVSVPDVGLRRALVRSLRRFQIGERDGSRITDQVMTSDDPFLTEPLRVAIRAYIGEEHQHGRLLEALLRRLGSEPAARDASAAAFKVVRRLLGLRGKIMVLVAAEMVGAAFYNAVVETVDDDSVRSVLASIRDDERAHLRFGVVLTSAMVATGSTRGAQWRWRCGLLVWLWAVTLGALLVVSADHAPLLRRAGWRRVAVPVIADLWWFSREL